MEILPVKRSGMLTFAGVMLLIAGSFNMLDGVVALTKDEYVPHRRAALRGSVGVGVLVAVRRPADGVDRLPGRTSARKPGSGSASGCRAEHLHPAHVPRRPPRLGDLDHGPRRDRDLGGVRQRGRVRVSAGQLSRRHVGGVDHDGAGEPVLQPAPAVVDEDQQEAGEQRDRGQHHAREPHDGGAQAHRLTAVRAHHADPHDARARRLPGRGPERREVAHEPREVGHPADRDRDRDDDVGDVERRDAEPDDDRDDRRGEVDERHVDRERDRPGHEPRVVAGLVVHEAPGFGSGPVGGSIRGRRRSSRRVVRSTTASAVRERSRTSPATWSAKP